MKIEKKARSNLLLKIAIIVVILYMVAMCFVYNYKMFFYENYETIHNDIDSNMPGYEIPIAKNIELANNRVTNEIAYDKYNVTPEQYLKLVKELKESEEKAEEDKICFNDCFFYAMKECGMGYKMSYKIISAEKIKVEEVDSGKGVTDMYDVKFEINISDTSGEELNSISYERKIVEVDGEWIFYENYFSVPGYFLSFYKPIDIGVE